MAFSTNYDDIGGGSELLPEGKYEVIIRSAGLNTTKKGTPYIDIRMVIRNDIQQQKYQNKYIFHSIWKKKEPTPSDNQVDGYSFKQLMALAKAAKLPAGKNYAAIGDLCKDFINRCVNVEIEHQTDDNGKVHERVKYVKDTVYPECKHVYKELPTISNTAYKPPKQDAFAQPPTVQPYTLDINDFEEITSGDLPF